MKAAPSAGASDRRSNINLAYYNLHFLEQCIGIKVPESTFFYEKGGSYIGDDGISHEASYYLGSKFIEEFKPCRELRKLWHKMYFKQQKVLLNHEVDLDAVNRFFRRQLISEVGEIGLSRLAVASTFIHDISNNDGNWGVANNRLVIVDADLSPNSLGEYFDLARKMPTSLNIELSLHNLRQMKNIYAKMKKTLPPIINQRVDFNPETYQTLASTFYTTMIQAIAELESLGLGEHQPSHDINLLLTRHFHAQLLDHIEAKSPTVSL